MEIPDRVADLMAFGEFVLRPEVEKMLEKHFRSKGGAFGTRSKWAPWAEETRLKRLRKGNISKGILTDEDVLFDSLFAEESMNIDSEHDGIRLVLNTGVRYSIFHQLGTVYMPERQVIPDPLPVSFVRRIKKLLRAYVLTGDMG